VASAVCHEPDLFSSLSGVLLVQQCLHCGPLAAIFIPLVERNEQRATRHQFIKLLVLDYIEKMCYNFSNIK
jgi:hypothetical protein